YVIYMTLGKKKIQLNKTGVFSFGVLAGFFSGVFSTGGPLYVICVENTVKDIRVFRATMIGVLGSVTLTRVPALAISGLLNLHHLKMALLAFPIFMLAQYLGKLTFTHIHKKTFKKSLVILLCISGLLLLF